MPDAHMAVGWVGLGSIGSQMVKRLLAAGERVTVYPRGAGLADARAAGAADCADYAALAAQSDVLILCVYNDAQLIDILFTHAALDALRPGTTLVIHTTGSPDLARRIEAQAPAGTAVLDACFSGGPNDVAAGQLTLMVGGDEAALTRVTSLLGHYAQHIHGVGPVGQGQTVKLLNNLLFATNLMNAAELLALGEKQGLAPSTLAQVMATCSGASYALGLFANPLPTATMMQAIRPYLEKDVATAITTAQEAGLDIDMFQPCATYFTAA